MADVPYRLFELIISPVQGIDIGQAIDVVVDIKITIFTNKNLSRLAKSQQELGYIDALK